MKGKPPVKFHKEKMQVNTYLADSIERTEYESRYDDYAKMLTASIPVLARILQQTVEELRDNSLEDIEKCIEGPPQVQLSANDNSEDTKEKIEENNTESTIVHEGTVRYVQECRGILESIWLCTDTPEKIANTISEYTMTRKEVYGDFSEEERYDLLTVEFQQKKMVK